MSNVLAITIELGVPTVLIVLLFFAPKLRPMCYSILGAVIPFLFAYVSAFLGYSEADQSELPFPIEDIWAMTLPAYCLAIIVGIVLGFFSKPTHSAMRISAASLASIFCITVFVWLT